MGTPRPARPTSAVPVAFAGGGLRNPFLPDNDLRHSADSATRAGAHGWKAGPTASPMPYASILASSVGRLMPSSRAAPRLAPLRALQRLPDDAGLELDRRPPGPSPSAASRRVPRRARAPLARRRRAELSTSGTMTRSERADARWISLRSSRTLPGQSWAIRTCSASSLTVRGAACRSPPRTPPRKRSTSSGMSSRRSRSGGRSTVITCEAVVEILAEAALLAERLQVLVAGGEDAHVDGDRPARPPTGRTSLSCSTRRSFFCMLDVHVADLVEEQRAAVGRPRRAPSGSPWRR